MQIYRQSPLVGPPALRLVLAPLAVYSLTTDYICLPFLHIPTYLITLYVHGSRFTTPRILAQTYEKKFHHAR